MLFFKKQKANKDFRNRIIAAFPKNLQGDVDHVIEAIEKDLFVAEKTDYNLRTTSHVFTLSSNEQVSIPYRIWLDDCENSIELTPVQQKILHCIYSRSTDGYVREKHIRAILEADIPFWAFPFVLKLCDEYVCEILSSIYDCLRVRDNSDIQAFCLMNISYFVYSHARMISYWDCFYRDQCYKYNEYIGKKLYDECFGYTRKYEKYYDKSLLTSYQPKKPADCMPPWSR